MTVGLGNGKRSAKRAALIRPPLAKPVVEQGMPTRVGDYLEDLQA